MLRVSTRPPPGSSGGLSSASTLSEKADQPQATNRQQKQQSNVEDQYLAIGSHLCRRRRGELRQPLGALLRQLLGSSIGTLSPTSNLSD